MTPQEIYGLAYNYYKGDNGKEQNYQKAYELCIKAAEMGHSTAMALVGHMFYWGEGVEKNLEEALRWYLISAEQDNPIGQFRLALMLAKGEGIEQNNEEALKWYRRAAENGYSKAQYKLGRIYHYGEGVERNLQEAKKWYELSASQGNKHAQLGLGLIYFKIRRREKHGVKTNYNKAEKWFRLAAEQNLGQAQKYLGEMYLRGCGVDINLDEAERWYKLAIENGDNSAKEGLDEIKAIKDKETKFQRCLSAAKEGDPEAQYKLAHEYHYGDEIEWYRSAAEQGHCEAQYGLGKFYMHGSKGLKKDMRESEKWFRLSAEQGHAIAQYYMGEIYRCGLGVKRDYGEAAKWHKLSADQTITESMRSISKRWHRSFIAESRYLLGYMYEAGYGVEKNIEEALLWYKSSADEYNQSAMRRIAQEKYKKAEYEEAYQWYKKSGCEDSLVNMAEMHIYGLGCEKSMDKAINLLVEAAKLNSELAMYKLSQIYIGEYGTEINLNEYVRNLTRCRDIRSQLKLAESYCCGIHVGQDMYKAVRIWQDIARQGYKCVHYNLAIAYYYGVGTDKDKTLALEYLNEVKSYDDNACQLLSALTGPELTPSQPAFRQELKRADIKEGSILEAEWKYINIRSPHINEKFNEQIREDHRYL